MGSSMGREILGGQREEGRKEAEEETEKQTEEGGSREGVRLTPPAVPGTTGEHESAAPASPTRPGGATPQSYQTLRDEAERELAAAQTEVASLGAGASPARLERALERLAAAQHALAGVMSLAA